MSEEQEIYGPLDWKPGETYNDSDIIDSALERFGFERRAGHVTGAIWGNGQLMDVCVHLEGIEGQDPSDIIDMSIVPAGGERIGWFMNIEDAVTLIRLLSASIEFILSVGHEMVAREDALEEGETGD